MPEEGTPPGFRSRVAEWSRLIIAAVALSFLLRVSVVEAYVIPSGSMEETILTGDTLLGNKFIYGARIPLVGIRLPALREPRPGDVVVFNHPVEEGRLVKRVVATAGQRVEIRDKQVYVDGRMAPLPEAGLHLDPRTLPPGVSRRDNAGPFTVPEGHLFVMGDNRDDSLDSRSWGFLDREEVLARAMFVLYSYEHDPTEPFWQRIRWGRIFHDID
ncbi:MAG: signal peptidase I [bacterium]